MPDGGISLDRPIALIGMMASGKSTVGKVLAKRLSVSLIDTDKEIERSAGMPTAELFDRFGEDHFRSLERALVLRMDLSRTMVIATGGGMFTHAEVRERLLRRCYTVWLDAPSEVLAGRLNEAPQRPLLRGTDAANILARISRERRETYALAEIHVNSGEGRPEATADRILQALKGPAR